jgi:hypothetical protein
MMRQIRRAASSEQMDGGGSHSQWSAVAKVSMVTPLHRGGWGLKAMERGVDGFGRTSAENRPKAADA